MDQGSDPQLEALEVQLSGNAGESTLQAAGFLQMPLLTRPVLSCSECATTKCSALFRPACADLFYSSEELTGNLRPSCAKSLAPADHGS